MPLLMPGDQLHHQLHHCALLLVNDQALRSKLVWWKPSLYKWKLETLRTTQHVDDGKAFVGEENSAQLYGQDIGLSQ